MSFQNELDLAVSIWNNHTIRRSRNQNVPFGQPNQMFNYPCLWETRDFIQPDTQEDLDLCQQEVEFRSVIPCDPDIYDLCIDILRQEDMIILMMQIKQCIFINYCVGK